MKIISGQFYLHLDRYHCKIDQHEYILLGLGRIELIKENQILSENLSKCIVSINK
jgi:hypothetical protein